MAEQGVPTPLVEVREMTVHFPVRSGFLLRQTGSVRAVDGVSFRIEPGETLGLVGESGCGKTTTGRALLRLTEPTSGQVLFAGQDVTALGGNELRRARRNMQMIFQDPYGSLNPRMRVEDIVGDPLSVHGLARGQARRKRVGELLEMVGLSARYARRFPHEFSGGQRQRIGIARALSTEPQFIICDEPVSALDVSIQAQVLNVLISLRDRLNLTYLFIAHDLAVVRHFSDRVAVMYLGKIVEVGPPSAVYERAVHPYTQALLSAIPVPDPKKERRRRRIILAGDVPSPVAPPSGCRFHNRCWLYQKLGQPERCRTEEPLLETVGASHQSACHFPAEARAAAANPGTNANPVQPAGLEAAER